MVDHAIINFINKGKYRLHATKWLLLKKYRMSCCGNLQNYYLKLVIIDLTTWWQQKKTTQHYHCVNISVYLTWQTWEQNLLSVWQSLVNRLITTHNDAITAALVIWCFLELDSHLLTKKSGLLSVSCKFLDRMKV